MEHEHPDVDTPPPSLGGGATNHRTIRDIFGPPSPSPSGASLAPTTGGGYSPGSRPQPVAAIPSRNPNINNNNNMNNNNNNNNNNNRSGNTFHAAGQDDDVSSYYTDDVSADDASFASANDVGASLLLRNAQTAAQQGALPAANNNNNNNNNNMNNMNNNMNNNSSSSNAVGIGGGLDGDNDAAKRMRAASYVSGNFEPARRAAVSSAGAMDGLQLFRVDEGPDNATFAPLPNYFERAKAISEEDDGAGKMNTLFGVYLPCLQNILGVILFLRLPWIVGHAGISQSCGIILVCASATFLTALSMSAIATNGKVPAGGAYYLISRALGPEFGGAVGILFYLGTTFAGAMYVLGGVEAIKVSFDEATIYEPADFQIFGLIMLLVLVSLVFVGVKYVNMAAMPFLGCVLIAVLSIIVGVTTYKSDSRCAFVASGVPYDPTAPVVNASAAPARNFSDVIPFGRAARPAAGGVALGVLQGKPASQDENPASTPDPASNLGPFGPTAAAATGNSSSNETSVPEFQCIGMKAAIHRENMHGGYRDGTSFQSLVALFFPSVTGIMAGSNRSGVLANPGQSIPKGTLLAILTTTAIYLLNVVLFGSAVPRALLRLDEYKLVAAIVGWPSEWVVRSGILLSTIGAGLQSLVGAPMLLQAIANDDLIPVLKFFGGKGQPRRALYLTAVVCALAVLAGNVDAVAPIITMFFLLCYAFVNLACFLLAWLEDPNFRPTWRFFHWGTALLGALWCVALMLFISWYFALAAIVIAAAVYKFIEIRGVDANWGDGLKGLSYQNALRSLLKLDAIRETHSKNWKPQILALVKMGGTTDPELIDLQILSFVRQLKKGKGLNMFAHVIEGNTSERAPAAQNARYNLLASLKEEGLEGFAEVVVSSNYAHGVNALVQTAGLGGLKPNTILLGFPESWKTDVIKAQVVADTVNSCRDLRKAVVLMRGVPHFPGRSETLAGTLDVWWIVHDGGMLLLLAVLLQRKREWHHTRVRVFSVARPTDNTLQLKRDIQALLTALRMDGTVEDPVELDGSEVSAFTYERTIEMNKRRKLQTELRVQLANAADRDQQHALIDDFERNADEQHESSCNETIKGLDTAVKLNKHMLQRSNRASLVIVNLPPPKVDVDPLVYMEYLDALSAGLTRVLLVRGSGREVVTANA